MLLTMGVLLSQEQGSFQGDCNQVGALHGGYPQSQACWEAESVSGTSESHPAGTVLSLWKRFISRLLPPDSLLL